MYETIRLRPDSTRLLGGGNLLTFLAQIKSLLGQFDVEITRLPELLGLISTVAGADYHTVPGARAGLSALVDIADILVLEDETVKGLNDLLAAEGPLNLAVWLLNTLTGWKGESDAGVLPLVAMVDFTPSMLTKWLPLILQLIDILRLFGVKL